MRHRGLDGASVHELNRSGALGMVSEYAAVLVATFVSGSFDLIGASFGAVLALHVANGARAAGGCPRRLVLVDPPPAVPSELPVPKLASSLRTAAMGVLLLQLRVEMGATVWGHFPQLMTLPEAALPHFLAAQTVPAGFAVEELVPSAQRISRLLNVYRQCRHAFHLYSASVEAYPGSSGSVVEGSWGSVVEGSLGSVVEGSCGSAVEGSCGNDIGANFNSSSSSPVDSDSNSSSSSSPAILMVLSSGRWPTFCEMFPGLQEDDLHRYGPAATLRLPGRHVEVVNRCLSNKDADFTGALQRHAAIHGKSRLSWLRSNYGTNLSNIQLRDIYWTLSVAPPAFCEF